MDYLTEPFVTRLWLDSSPVRHWYKLLEKAPRSWVSHMVLYGKLVFNKNWNGKWNRALGTGYSPAHMEWVCSISQRGSSANESACKTLSLVRAGMWRQALLIKLSETWKKIHFMCSEGWRRPCGGVRPCSKGRLPTVWLPEYLEEQYAEHCHQSLICNLQSNTA